MMISGNVITICVKQVEPTDINDGWTVWENYKYSKHLLDMFTEQGYQLVA